MAKRAANYDRQYEAALRSLDALKPGVHSIFQKLGSADSAVAEALAAAGVTDGNIMTHLGLIEQRVSELMHMYELSLAGVPLTLPTEEEEAAAAVSGAPPGSPPLRIMPDVEISRVGGVGSSEGTARNRRAVVSAPVPPSLADLDESDDEGGDVFLTMPAVSGLGDGPGGGRGTMRTRRASAGRAAADDGGGGGSGGGGGEAELTEPMSLDQLRAHTISLVERKQARAERRERLAEQARVAFLDTLPPSTAAAMYSATRGTRLSGTSTSAAATAAASPATAARPMTTAGASVRSGGSTRGGDQDRPSTADATFVPKPPAMPPPMRPGAARPGPRAVVAARS